MTLQDAGVLPPLHRVIWSCCGQAPTASRQVWFKVKFRRCCEPGLPKAKLLPVPFLFPDPPPCSTPAFCSLPTTVGSSVPIL